jgi:hypothetical protein
MPSDGAPKKSHKTSNVQGGWTLGRSLLGKWNSLTLEAFSMMEEAKVVLLRSNLYATSFCEKECLSSDKSY